MDIGKVKELWRYPVKSMAGETLASSYVDAGGIRGDRGWALKDESTGEITNAKRIPILMQCAASYCDEPQLGGATVALINLADGSQLSTDDPLLNKRLSEFLGRNVSLWPLQPASDKEHYRRKTQAARVFGKLAQYSAVRAALPMLTSFGQANRELREAFSREPDEPVPDISLLPPEVLEFTSPLGTYFDAYTIHLLTTASLETMKEFNAESKWDRCRFRPNLLIETNKGLSGLVESKWKGSVLKVGQMQLRCEIPTPRCGMTTHAQKDLPKDPAILRSIVRNANQNLGTYATVIIPGQIAVGDKVELFSDQKH